MVAQANTRLLSFLFLLFLPLFSFSETKPKRIQRALVSVEKSNVYEKPSFDSPVIGSVKYGSKILVTTKIYKGVGGFGAFYRTKLKNKKIGYITDIEIIPEYIIIGNKLRPNEEYKEFGLKEKTKHLEDIYLSRYLGGSASWVSLTEKWGKKTFTKFVPFFGLRLTGPKFISEQFPWDLEILVNPFLPKYYKEIVLKEDEGEIINSSGFHVQSSLLFNLPLSQTIFRLIYAGLGPTFFFRNITLETSENNSYELKKLRLGATLQFGLAYRVYERYLFRIEGRYHWESSRYISAGLSFQKVF